MTGAAGLRPRLVAWFSAVLLGVLAVTFAVVYERTGIELRSQITADSGNDVSQLTQAARALPASSPAELSRRLRSYVRGQPYGADSTLLFAVVSGHPPVSNHPELLGAAPAGDGDDAGETASVQRRENHDAAAIVDSADGRRTVQAPDAGAFELTVRTITVAGVRVRLGAGEPLAAVARAQRGVARSFVIAGAIGLVLALVAAWISGSALTRPLRRLARLADRVDHGESEVEMRVPPRAAREVRVLADALDHMLVRLAAAFAQQQRFIADASHELRTPLTVIGGQVELLAAQESPSADEVRRVGRLVAAEIARTSRLVDDMLLLARAEQDDFVRPEPLDLPRFTAELWGATTHGRERAFELSTVPVGVLCADPDRLAQALRNLIENAIAHTEAPAGHVALEVDAAGGWARFVVSDDGPGIPEAERERVFERLHRVDEARARVSGGAGLGLSIVRAIADAHGGRVAAVDAPRGARIELEIPGFTRGNRTREPGRTHRVGR